MDDNKTSNEGGEKIEVKSTTTQPSQKPNQSPPPAPQDQKPQQVGTASEQKPVEAPVNEPHVHASGPAASTTAGSGQTEHATAVPEAGKAPEVAAATQSAQPTQKPVQHHNNKKLAAIVTILVALTLAGVAVFVYVSTNDNTEEGTIQSDTQIEQSAVEPLPPATAESVDEAVQEIDEALNFIDEEGSFNESETSDGELGL